MPTVTDIRNHSAYFKSKVAIAARRLCQPQQPVARLTQVVCISRDSFYHRPRLVGEAGSVSMRRIDGSHLLRTRACGRTLWEESQIRVGVSGACT